MSESMAFIGGVAVAGLAALVLLKGAGGNSLPNYTVGSQLQPAVVAPSAMMPPTATYPGQPYPNPAPVNPNNEEMRVQAERLKMENEGLKNENNGLKTQVQQLQSQIQQVYNYQVQLNQQNQQQNAAQLQQHQSAENRWWSSPVVWAVGGITLTIGGGIVVAGVLALFSPKERPTRTVQVIHPYNGPTPPLAPVRRAEFLPPRTERRVEAQEYDDMY